MPKRLSGSQLDQFNELGYVSGLRLFAPGDCAAMRNRIEAFEAERPADAAWAFDIKANLLFDWVYQASAHEPTLDAVEDLLGPNIFNTNTVFRIKEAGSATNYGWHQDAARIGVDPCFVIAYLAITESTPDNGGLRVIPGSHRTVLPFDVVVNDDGQAQRKVARTINVRDADAVDLALEPGEVTLFSGLLVHGSGPNRSRRRRIAILTDYTAAHARQSRGQGSGQLVRGADSWGYTAKEPIPVGSCTEANILMRRRILATYPENPLMGPLAPGEAARFPDQPAFISLA
ncbi:MAG TPA: phytanoyl-CoA dioxygenase family protein [Kiloniellales bacterium]